MCTDMFRGDKMDKLCLKGLDHVLAFSVVEGKILMRAYTLRFKKGASRVCVWHRGGGGGRMLCVVICIMCVSYDVYE